MEFEALKRGQRSNQCRVCAHPDRYRCELLLAGGASVRSVATKLDLSPDSVWRHWTRHCSSDRKAQLIAGPLKLNQLAERAAEEGLSLVEYLSLIRTVLLGQFTTCAEAGDRHGTAVIAGRLLETLREIGRLTGELNRIGGVNVTNTIMLVNSPAFAELQTMLLERLAAFPEARAAVLQGLRDLDHRLGTASAAPPLIEGVAA